MPPFLRKGRKRKRTKKVKVVQSLQAVAVDDDDDDATAAETTAAALTLPIFDESAWMAQSGREFVDHPDRVDALATMGLDVVRQSPADGNAWIDWKVHGSTSATQEDSSDDEAVYVWTGASKVAGYGSHTPWIKTKAVVPLSPTALVELMLDSSRVKTYNSWSTGRDDLWVRSSDASSSSDAAAASTTTKIVRNRTAPPMGKPLVATTLLHARPLAERDSDSWLLVSRAVGGAAFPLNQDTGVSEMLLGVNLLEAIPGRPDACVMTALTHVYSKAIPAMLAERLGVQSAVQFVKDMRGLATTATTAES